MKKIWQLFLTFFKLGAFTFGGGYAMISLIESEIVDKKGWLTRDEMLDIITIAESTPGPLAINMATFVGTKVKGLLGAVIATLGLVIPPFVIILAITLVLNEFKSIALVAYALKGIQAGVVVLIFNASLKFLKGMDKSIISYIFLAVAFFVALLTDFSVVLIIVIGAALGIIIMLISSLIARKKVAKAVDTKDSDSIKSLEDSQSNDIEQDATIDTANISNADAAGIVEPNDNLDDNIDNEEDAR